MIKHHSNLLVNKTVECSSDDWRLEKHQLTDSTQQPVVESTVSYFGDLYSFSKHWWSNELIERELEYLHHHFKRENLTFYSGMTQAELIQQLEQQSEADLERLEDELGYLNTLYQIQENLLSLPERKGMSLESIHALEAGTAQGTQLVKSYQSETDFIFLYSECEAETYWKNQGFVPFADGYYLWSQQSDLLDCVTPLL